ncbi:hypothetical protein BB558_001183 [Smittium angustum]|uniref:Uncharacterized protein n=1 Tax=Smittium angustum TaxID=133377 RepID=A0A2U1JCE2_SMIAN|nr:hypothetical protein BB558_001183 [Smittium angustum]
MNLAESYIKCVPANYQEQASILSTINASITFTNFFFVNDSAIKEKYTGFYDRMVSLYNSFGKYSDVISSLNMFIKYIIDVKTKANEQNKKLKHLHKNMVHFGISESDIDPWIAPKYGSPFHLQCCGKGNFSVLDIGGYLEEKITSVNIFEQDNHTEAYEQVRKNIRIETSLDKKDINKQLGKTNEYVLDFGSIPIIEKTEKLDSNGVTNYFMSFLTNAKQESSKAKEESDLTSKLVQTKTKTRKKTLDFENKNIENIENDYHIRLSYLMSIGNIVGKSITKTESYEGTLNFSIAPGRCKYATITYEMARIRASGSCSYWYTTYKPILEIQFLEYAKNITNFELVETAKD